MTQQFRKRFLIAWAIIGIPLLLYCLREANFEHHMAQAIVSDPINQVVRKLRGPNAKPDIASEYYDAHILWRNLYLLSVLAIAVAPVALWFYGRTRSPSALPSGMRLSAAASTATTHRSTRQRAAIVGAAVAVAAIIVVTWHFVSQSRLKSSAEEAVASELYDPEAARFRNVRVVRDAVCGQVNGKNRLGAYVGYQDFVYYKGAVDIDTEPERELGSTYLKSDPKYRIRRMCEE